MLLSEQACHRGHSSVYAVVDPQCLQLSSHTWLHWHSGPSHLQWPKFGVLSLSSYLHLRLKVMEETKRQASVVEEDKMSINITNTSLWNTSRNLIRHLLLYSQFTYRVGPLNSTLLVKNQAKFYMVIAVYPKQKCDQDNLPGNLKWGSKSPFMKYSWIFKWVCFMQDLPR